MIFDHMQHASLYYGIHPRIEQALRYLQETDVTTFAPGKFAIDGERIFALVQHYDSRPLEAGIWEAHRRYFDIQYVTEGAELMGVGSIGRMNVSKAYDETADLALFTGAGSFFELQAGYFTILAPQDVHMACIAVRDPQPVRKIVLKVAV